MALTVLAAYDITNDGRRSRVAAVLQSWGDRIQYSLFVCLVGPDELPILVDKVRKIIDPDEDSFFVIRQCGACWADMMALGQAHPPQPELYWAAL